MDLKHLKRLGAMAATAAVALILVGCNGSSGSTGATGAQGQQGPQGNPGQNGSNGANGVNSFINVANLTPAEWGALSLTGSVTSVDLSQGTPIVNFTVTDTNSTPVVGLGWQTQTSRAAAVANGATSYSVMPSYSNLAFTIAKLVPGSGANTSQWVNYIVTSTPAEKINNAQDPTKDTATPMAPGKPSTDSTGTLVDHGDGTYTYTFYRDITKAQSFLDGASYSGNNTRADLGDVSYQAALTHRIAIQVGGTARGTGTNTPDGSTAAPAVNIKNPANIWSDFIPATGKAPASSDLDRVINNVAACNACHTRLEVHGGNRVDPNYCTVCHTDQRKYGNANTTISSGALVPPSGQANNATYTYKINGLATGNMPAFIHRLHMGESLHVTGYNYANILFNDVRYPQDIRNCQTCHTNQPQSTVPDAPPVAPQTAQGDNWMTAPSRLACGACHDDVDFTAGHGPNNSIPSTDTQDDHLCNLCHQPADIAIYHTPVWTPSQAGSDQVPAHGGIQSYSYQATNPANLPAGAHRIDYKLISAAVNASGVPSLTFSILMDGSPIALNAPPASPLPSVSPATGTAAATTQADMFPASVPFVNNMFGSAFNAPEFFLIAGLPQDGIIPADFNFRVTPTLKDIWSGAVAAGNVKSTLPMTWTDNGNSTYTITATGYPLPTGTGVVAMGIGLGMLTETDLSKPSPSLISNWNPTPGAFTQMDFTYNSKSYTAAPTGGLIIPSKAQMMNVAASKTPGGVPAFSRRNIIKPDACNTCHGTLGAFTAVVGADNFHSVGIGDGNDGASCVICHNTTGVDSSAWSYNTKPWVHALHAGGMRNNAYTAHSGSGSDFWNIEYPGLLNNCEVCHVPGSYDFSNATNAAQVQNMLWDTVASGTPALSPSATYPAVKTTSAGLITHYSQPTSVAQAAAQGLTYVPPALAVPASNLTTGTGYYAPFISMTATYGSNAKWTAPATTGGAWTYTGAAVAGLTADAITAPTITTGSLVVSPITSACSSCHDTPQDIAHFQGNGGVFYGDRYVVGGKQFGTPYASGSSFAWPTGNLVNTEQCLICHGPGAAADIQTAHMNF